MAPPEAPGQTAAEPVAEPPAAAPKGAAVKDPIAASAVRPPATATDMADFDRTLIAADERINALVREPASDEMDALRRREVAESAIEAFAQEHIDRVLAGATVVTTASSDPAERARRTACVKVLAFSNDRRATAAAVQALAAVGDPALRTAAAYALARLADPDTDIDALVAAVRDSDADVRVNALTALARVLDARGGVGNFIDVRTRDTLLPVLETAMFDPKDAAVRGRAAAAARALGDPRVVPSLVNLLRDKDPFVRMHTALALSRYGDREEVQPLIDVIDDTPRGPARTAVLGSLARILRRENVHVPEGLADNQSAWEDLVRRAYIEKDREPLR